LPRMAVFPPDERIKIIRNRLNQILHSKVNQLI
jgi:hypothetical protein